MRNDYDKDLILLNYGYAPNRSFKKSEKEASLWMYPTEVLFEEVLVDIPMGLHTAIWGNDIHLHGDCSQVKYEKACTGARRRL